MALFSSDFTHAMVGRSEHGMMLEGQMRLNQRIMKRNLSRCRTLGVATCTCLSRQKIHRSIIT